MFLFGEKIILLKYHLSSYIIKNMKRDKKLNPDSIDK